MTLALSYDGWSLLQFHQSGSWHLINTTSRTATRNAVRDVILKEDLLISEFSMLSILSLSMYNITKKNTDFWVLCHASHIPVLPFCGPHKTFSFCPHFYAEFTFHKRFVLTLYEMWNKDRNVCRPCVYSCGGSSFRSGWVTVVCWLV